MLRHGFEGLKPLYNNHHEIVTILLHCIYVRNTVCHPEGKERPKDLRRSRSRMVHTG